MRNLRLVCSAITIGPLAASGANSAPNVFPGRKGRIVFASDRAIPGQPQADYENGEIYSLDLASGRSRDLSRATADESDGSSLRRLTDIDWQRRIHR